MCHVAHFVANTLLDLENPEVIHRLTVVVSDYLRKNLGFLAKIGNFWNFGWTGVEPQL